ncbi:hypothetical protein EON63_14805 [archaeon]|nr:MAG: hypothetical protein EON63_14805 [archaeon]
MTRAELLPLYTIHHIPYSIHHTSCTIQHTPDVIGHIWSFDYVCVVLTYCHHLVFPGILRTG